jgi:signal transduction histidine kinase/CheY-like chemotaxis protein
VAKSTTSPIAPSVRSLLTRFAVVAFLVVGTALILGKVAVDAVIRRVEQEEMRDQGTRSRFAFDRIARRARQQVESYAGWDETIRLAQHPSDPDASGFFQRNFVDWIPRNDYDFIELLDDRRQRAFHWSAEAGGRSPWMATAPTFLDSLRGTPSIGGWVRDGDALYLVAGAAVRPGSRALDVQPSGYLIIGRRMDAAALATFERDQQVAVRVHAPSIALPDTPEHFEFFANDDSVRTYFSLGGVAGPPAAVIELLDSRSDLHRISQYTLYGALAGVMFGGGAFLLVWLYGRRLLITPLRAIALEIVGMHGRGELAEVSSAAPSEEWALFLETFNDTVRSLRESEVRYRTLFDHSVDPYFLVDAATRRVLDVNPAAASVFGQPRQAFVAAQLPAPLADRIGDTVRVRRPDGTSRSWGIAETSLTVGDRGLVLVALRDLTDRDALAQSQKMDAIGSLAGGIAHDFNNLMGAVLAGVRVARTDAPDERRRSALDAIEHAGRRAAELTRQLLGVSRHEPMVRVPVDIVAAIGNTRRMAESTFDRRITIETALWPSLPAVEGDPGQLEQALLNLCINARDAMPAGGTLTLSARLAVVDTAAALALRDIQPGSYVVIGVADTGVGMTDDVKQRIFEPFFTTKPRDKGTGLGLAMVHGLVRSTGGTITVDSTPGTGTTIELYLPASAHAPRRPTPPLEQEPVVRTPDEQPTVLVADDERGLREMMRMVLEHEGYAVLEASDGADALRMVDAHAEIDAVLLDVQMPVLNGLDAYVRLRERHPALPVMLGTGYVGDAELTALRDAGADELLTKPYDIRELLERLARLTGARA